MRLQASKFTTTYLQFLGIVGQTGEEDDAEHEEEDEQSQFLCRCLERVYENA